jgi:ELWxxDGT repeat protein
MAKRVVLFRATDSSSDTGLWETNGTAAGTTEIGGLANAGVSGAYKFGLNPSDLTSFGGLDLFEGSDSGGDPGLWVTNGTAVGTTEIGGVNDAGVSGAWSGGLDPRFMTVLGTEVLFNGFDSADNQGLWATNGTAAGTTEIGGLANAGVSGASPSGLTPSNMVALGNQVLFNGFDSKGSGHLALWVTNGTAAGTTEIGGLANAGVSGASSSGLNPSSMVVLGNQVLFDGLDSSGHFSLWETNGTAAGTTEIGGDGNAGISGVNASGLEPADLVAFGGEVLFDGFDSANNQGLWLTDGTAAGTTEIGGLHDAGVSGASATGLNPTNLIAFGGEMLFEGTDSSGHLALWMTNGTAAGTTEIGGLANAGVTGASSSGLNPSDMVVFGNQVLFRGLDSGGKEGLWETNGTAAGTMEIGGLSDAGVSGANTTFGLSPSDLTILGKTTTLEDFTGNGVSDVLLQNGGTVVDWIMANGAYQNGNVITNGASGYTIVGTGDFNADGTADVLLQNGGTVVDWIMKNGVYQNGNVITNGATGYKVVGTGDLNGDGTADVLLQNGGIVVDWIMNNGVYQSGNVLTNGAAGWTVVGTGDFNGDGTSDVLLQNGGTVVDWIMQNGVYQSGNVLTSGAAGWTVVGTGDFNGDGTSDVLLQNGGTVVDWIMGNGVYQSGNVITNGAVGWNVVGTGDYNGDGTSDVLLQNGGTVVDWIMKNGSFQSGNVITTGALGYTVARG